MLDAYIMLGCNGHVGDDNFTYCNSVLNPVVDLKKNGAHSNVALMDFLDNSCGLFDGVCLDRNKIVNIINMLYRDFGILSDESLHKIQAFIRMHKICGIYLMLLLKEDFEDVRFKNTNQ